MKKTKKILAIVLSVIMIFSIFPSAVLATEADVTGMTAEYAAEAVDASSEEQEVESTVEDVSEETVQEEADVPADPAEEQDAAPASEESAEPAADETTATAVEESADAVDVPVTLEVKGDDYTVTATFDATAGFPADVQMKVEEIRETAEDYNTYLDQALVAAQKESEKEVELTFARFFDITFYNEQGEVQPSGKVNISIKYDEAIDVESKEDVSVLHFEDEKKEEPQPVEVKPEDINDTVDEVSFDADSFSVYAVIGTGAVARMTVNFYGADGETIVDTMLVKNSDSLEDLEKIIFDPGAGTIEAGYSFYGWSVDDLKKSDGSYYTDTEEYVGKGYKTNTPGKNIEEVRAYIRGLTITDGDILDVYAMRFAHYEVKYTDGKGEGGASLGSEGVLVKNKGDLVKYVVNMGYTTDETHKFEGWHPVVGEGNITDPADATKETLFENGREIQIKGDVTFSVEAPAGHWLIFDENGKGATYNAPRFYEVGDKTSAEGLIIPERNGYEFGGWYYNKECTEGKEFTFGSEITENTRIFAKWTAREKARYTVLIWRENLSSGYDFKEAIPLEGVVGSTIDSVKQYGIDNDAYVTVDGDAKQYTGFHLDSFDTGKTIAPEGNTVVNVYYKRTEYTLTFQVSADWFGWSWSTVKTIRAKYEANISDQFPIVGTNGVTYTTSRWDPQNSQTYNKVLVYIDVMPAENVTFHESTASHNSKFIYYYQEALPGQKVDRTYNEKDFVLYKTVECNYNFFTEAEDYIDLSGFNKGGPDGTQYPPEAFSTRDTSTGAFSGTVTRIWNNSSAMHVLCYYTRKAYPIIYMDGVYVDGNNNPIEDQDNRGLLKQTDPPITYGADIKSYNKGGDNYYAPTFDGYVFEGWYIDSACTQPYTFDTMPEGGITVYAKWRQIQYRVFLHPNVPQADTTLDWGSAEQKMNFRVSDGSEVSAPTGIRAGYEFFGWYTDSELTDPLKEGVKLNKDTVTTPYDNTVDMTDPMDKWGILGKDPYNEDYKQKRFWIEKKYDLYAKWSKVLKGAPGIGIVYETVGEKPVPKDALLYKDNTRAVAGAAPKLDDDDNKVFKNWVVQKWNGLDWEDTDVVVLPGGSFTVIAENAKITDESGTVVPPDQTEDSRDYFYTIRLIAKYVEKEKEVFTHIPWFNNNGKEAFYIDTITGEQTAADSTLSINEEVSIKKPTITREGYKFLGWAKVDMGNTAEAAAEWESTNDNWTQEKLTANDLFLYYKADKDKFYTEAGFTNEVEKVAADEATPYEAMFAVWEEIPKYYVYHSSIGKLEEFYMPQKNEKPDLTDLVPKGYMYGGYYETDAYEEGKTDYTKGEPYTASGMHLDPKADTVYYLKEVNLNYLKPQAYVVFDPKSTKVQELYGFVNVDDADDYSDCGLIVLNGVEYSCIDKDGPGLKELSKSVVFTRNGQTYATIGRSNFGTPFAKDESYPVWIGGIKLNDLIVGGTQIQFSGYYVTRDNIKVTGIKTRALQFEKGDPPTFTGWTSSGGNTITGIITQEAPEYTDMEPSEGNTNGVTTMATRSMLTIAAPADTISYTISKVYDSETETQTVEGGNQVGKISYTEKPGYVFAGWYQDETLTIPADFSNVQADMTVYARYISSSDISLSFSRKNVSGANVVFNVTVGVKNIGDFKEVNIICSKDGSETEDALTTKTTKKTGSGKNRKYTYCYKGTAALQDLSRGGTFVSTICWVTPDGTKVTGETYSCTYWLGFVVVQ